MALKRIVLRDFVIVRELELELTGGFTVLTGETGAGKSILIDALQLALGARADAGVVRAGANRAEVCAEFGTPSTLASWLETAGFDAAPTLLLRRVIDIQGKSRAWINGSPATATQLRELGEQLLDIHGQHAWQSLTRADSVRRLLDAYAANNLKHLNQLWQVWRDAHKRLQDARGAQASLQSERERLSWQISELAKLAPQQGEWDEINSRHARLSHAQALLDAATLALTTLENDGRSDEKSDSGNHSAVSQLSHAVDALRRHEHLEPQFRELADVLASSLAQAEDAMHTLHQYLRRSDRDSEGVAELDERMGLWMSLARRYRRPPEDLHALLATWKQELVTLDEATDLIALERDEQSSQAHYLAEAKLISKARIKAAPKLSAAVTAAMQDLGMKGGRFAVSVQALPELGQLGLDAVEFLVAGHAGHPPRPVGKVASGGELSRIALAIAVTTSQLGSAPTLIFDEVDSGIGGAVAETVGKLMRRLGQDRQVLAVTHLPQVAACADQQLLVSKQSVAGDTFSTLQPVSGERRVKEIARMLGGERLSDTTLAHAREMLSVVLDVDSDTAPQGEAQ